MQCKWIPFDGKVKCEVCGAIAPSDKFKRNCIHTKHETPPEGVKIPSLAQRAVNFGKAAMKHVAEGMRHCTDEQKQERYDKCATNECGLFVVQNDKGVCAHSSCGCFIRGNRKFMDKLSWADSACPLGRWGPITEKNDETPEKGV